MHERKFEEKGYTDDNKVFCLLKKNRIEIRTQTDGFFHSKFLLRTTNRSSSKYQNMNSFIKQMKVPANGLLGENAFILAFKFILLVFNF